MADAFDVSEVGSESSRSARGTVPLRPTIRRTVRQLHQISAAAPEIAITAQSQSISLSQKGKGKSSERPDPAAAVIADAAH